MEIVGYIAAALIGVSLGLIGGGGSIITIPVLVYLFNIEPALATSYSLFIVGSTSLVGGYISIKNRTADLRSSLLFALPSLASVFLTRRFLMPNIPAEIFSISGFSLTKSFLIMIFFSLIMIIAALRLLRIQQDHERAETDTSVGQLFFLGLGVGIVTGIVGAGGGFLIIPALVLLIGLPIKKAVGTSLVIIAINSLIGFWGDLQAHVAMNFEFLLLISAIALVGMFLGNHLSKFVHSQKLKVGFGWFILALALIITTKEILSVMA